jgi:hypothetical protein
VSQVITDAIDRYIDKQEWERLHAYGKAQGHRSSAIPKTTWNASSPKYGKSTVSVQVAADTTPISPSSMPKNPLPAEID